MERFFRGLKPIKDVRGLRTGNIPTEAPLLREAFDVPADGLYIYEDFRYGFSAREIDGTSGATTDPIASAPWRATFVDTDGDNAHVLLVNDSGQLQCVTNNNASDENAIQWCYEPVTGHVTWACEAKLKVDVAATCRLFFGFHNYKSGGTIAQTAGLGGSVSGFHVADGSASTAIVASSDNGTSTTTSLSGTTGGSLTNDTFVTLSLYHDNKDGTKFYVDGVLAATHTPSETDLGTTDAAPTLAIANTSGATSTATVEYMAFYCDDAQGS